VAAEIRRDGGRAIIVLGDLSQDEEVARIVEIAQAELGGVDILVNNAASGEHQNDMETAPSGWLDSYNTNLLSMVRLIQHLLPPMQEQGWGRIISISSGAAAKPSPGMGVYATTKAAMNALTVSLAQGMNDGVTINTVSPGAIITEKQIEMGKLHGMGNTREEIEAALNGMMESTPFGRMGRVEEVAAVVVFLASPLASYVHGANIRVDGGYVPTVN
jgi:3-oxoacyl-[acyl-carrier protein] reductase